MDGYKKIGIPNPVVIMISLEGVENVYLALLRDSFKYHSSKFDRPLIKLPEIVINNYGDHEDYEKKLKPVFDALWNAVGFPKALYFNDEGHYIPENK